MNVLAGSLLIASIMLFVALIRLALQARKVELEREWEVDPTGWQAISPASSTWTGQRGAQRLALEQIEVRVEVDPSREKRIQGSGARSS